MHSSVPREEHWFVDSREIDEASLFSDLPPEISPQHRLQLLESEDLWNGSKQVVLHMEDMALDPDRAVDDLETLVVRYCWKKLDCE